MRMTPRSLCAPIVFTLAFFACGPLHADVLYLALGDSTTFGNDESVPASTMPNFGDQGFVRPFANFLGSLNGGVRPQVTNLAISGELSSTFLTGFLPPEPPNPGWQFNLNYPKTPGSPNGTVSQNSLMLSALDAAHTAGNTVYVTLELGGNDFSHLIASSAWQTASPAEQQVLFLQGLNQLAVNYETILTEIQTHAPGAHILLPGFFDSTPPSDPSFALNELAIGAGDQLIQQIAPAFGATYVDFYSVINGHAAELTNPNGHANEAGYAALALALDAAVVPEPTSLLMMSVGISGLIVIRIRLRGPA